MKFVFKYSFSSLFLFCIYFLDILNIYCQTFALSSSSTNGEPISGEILAFFDPNYDRYTDLLVRQNKNSLAVYLASTEDSSFSEKKDFSVQLPWTDETIINVGVADFNGDSFPDLLVTTVLDEKKQTGIYNLSVCYGNGSNFNNCKRSNDDEWLNAKSQPVIMNCNDDQINDFFVVISNGTRICFLGHADAAAEMNFTSMNIFVKSKSEENPANLFPNAAHGFVDITGDFNADVVLLVDPKNGGDIPSFELWERTGKKEWSLNLIGIPEINIIKPKLMDDQSKKVKIGHVVFDDFNRDGRIDILLPYCSGDCLTITFLLCSTKDGKDWTWTLLEVPLNNTKHGGPNEQWSVDRSDEKFSPFVVRSGDYTQNGFPDLLVVLSKTDVKTDDNKALTSNAAFFVENIACVTELCKDFGRQFQMSWQPVSPCGSSKVKAAAYFDLNEDGTLDILFECGSDPSSSDAVGTIKFSPSAYTGDTTFLKVEVYTATCGSGCSNGKEGTLISLHGASLWYRMVDTEGNDISSIYTQQSCTSYKSLLLPYALFGIGRSPNFVEQLRVGIPSFPPANQTWQQIVPNSRMYVIPVPPELPGHWIGRLYVTPSRLILSSVAALGGVCTLLIIAIIILHWYELKADRKEKEAQRKHFHFDAM